MTKDKPEYSLGCTGHINLLRIKNFAVREQSLRREINAYFKRLVARYTPTLYCGLANGADSLFAEEALHCGIAVVAVLPEDINAFKQEQKDKALFTRLYNLASDVIRCKNGYVGVMEKILENSEEILTLWDGVEMPLTDANNNKINRGGTYDLIRTAMIASKKIKHFNQ